jgi:hypothetical protein
MGCTPTASILHLNSGSVLRDHFIPDEYLVGISPEQKRAGPDLLPLGCIFCRFPGSARLTETGGPLVGFIWEKGCA